MRENKAENQEKHPQKRGKTGFKTPQSLLFRTFLKTGVSAKRKNRPQKER